ncbi:MAG: peptidyl-prolyl cis-trans isomerase [Alphaproteobacteria bacterium]|nr:peptidyl-prolyl cis-trans isomerase [Alphaproteobacteria bacterium]
MLRSLRDGAKSGFLKYILLGLLVLAVGGLVLTDIGGFFRGGISSNLVAKGSGVEISVVEFDRTARRVLSRQGMSPQDAYKFGMMSQILNNEIQTRIMTYEAQKLGLIIDDETVTKQIAKLAEPLAAEGVSKKQALQQILRSQGISEGEFINAIRAEMGNTLLRNAVIGGSTKISDTEARDLYQYQNETRDLEVLTLPHESVKDIQPPTDMQLKTFYDSNKIDFLIPERRSVTIATLKKEMIEKDIQITDEELREIYDENIEAYKVDEKRTLEQAVLSTIDDAQAVLEKVKKGKSLEAAAKDVTGKTSTYLGENNFEKRGLLEEIAEPVFNAAKGDKIGPIQTALGWHVMILNEITPPQTESFESVKKDIKDELLQTRLMDDLVNAANTLDDQLASGEELEMLVKEFNLTTQKFENFNQGGLNKKNKDLFKDYQGDKAQILEAAFDFGTGESAPVMELADGRFIIVRIDNIEEASHTPFENVKNELKKRWINDQKRLANLGRASDAMKSLKSTENPAPFKSIASKYGRGIKTHKSLKRDGSNKGDLSDLTIQNAFDTATGDYIMHEAGENVVIAKIKSVNLPDPDKVKKADIEKIQELAAESIPQEMLAQYISSLSQKYKVRINERILNQLYGAPAE